MAPATTAQAAAIASAWAINHPQEMDWIGAHMETNGFAMGMAEALDKWGSLTERQVEAIRLNIQREAASSPTPTVNIAAIKAKFDVAHARQVKRPMMRLDAFVFKAVIKGANAGGIYVTQADDSEYLGKIVGGRFMRVAACSPDQEARIVAAASNPDEAAKAYGQRTGNCCICGRELTAEESLARFIGPICAEKYGMA